MPCRTPPFLVSEDLDQARRHVRELIQQRPEVILSGGGDGAAMSPPEPLAEGGGRELAGRRHPPPRHRERLGARVGAPQFFSHVHRLARMNGEKLPVQEVTLVEVENPLPFAGVGWDARILNDYQRNLDKRSSQLVGSAWLRAAQGGPRISLLARAHHHSEEWMRLPQGRARAGRAGKSRAGGVRRRERKAGAAARATQLHQGPISAGAHPACASGATPPRLPPRGTQPGFINVRVYKGTCSMRC